MVSSSPSSVEVEKVKKEKKEVVSSPVVHQKVIVKQEHVVVSSPLVSQESKPKPTAIPAKFSIDQTVHLSGHLLLPPPAPVPMSSPISTATSVTSPQAPQSTKRKMDKNTPSAEKEKQPKKSKVAVAVVATTDMAFTAPSSGSTFNVLQQLVKKTHENTRFHEFYDTCLTKIGQKNWIQTAATSSSTGGSKDLKVVGLDCEMVDAVGDDKALARVTLVTLGYPRPVSAFVVIEINNFFFLIFSFTMYSYTYIHMCVCALFEKVLSSFILSNK